MKFDFTKIKNNLEKLRFGRSKLGVEEAEILIARLTNKFEAMSEVASTTTRETNPDIIFLKMELKHLDRRVLRLKSIADENDYVNLTHPAKFKANLDKALIQLETTEEVFRNAGLRLPIESLSF